MMKQLYGGMLIRAKVDTQGISDSYELPAKIDIPAGTLLKVPSQGTRMGDVFCTLLEGEPIRHCRRENKPIPMKKSDNPNLSTKVGLSTRGGHEFPPCPHALGKIDTDVWEIVKS
jgi:hypothetical protein